MAIHDEIPNMNYLLIFYVDFLNLIGLIVAHSKQCQKFSFKNENPFYYHTEYSFTVIDQYFMYHVTKTLTYKCH